MPNFSQTLITSFTSLILAPIVLFLCFILLPLAVATTYFAFVALAVRAILVQIQVAAAILRRWSSLEEDCTNPSAWAPKAKLEELEIYQQRHIITRQSLQNTPTLTNLDFEYPPHHSESSTSSVRTIIPADTINLRTNSLSSDSGNASPSTSRGQSRPPSTRSTIVSRDYEGIGGWYTNQPGPKPESASFEWLVTNARLELPNADPASLTRPRTPEERRRSSSTGGRSHRSMVSLQRRHHERNATVGPFDIVRHGEDASLSSNSSRPSSLLERSRSHAHITEVENIVVGSSRTEETKNKSMMFFGERGIKLAVRLAGLKTLGTKKKSKSEVFSSPEGTVSDEHSLQSRDNETDSRGKRRKTANYEPGGGHSTGCSGSGSGPGSEPGSVDGLDTGVLSIWMRP